MTISLSEQLESDIKAYLHKTFGTYFSSLDERFAADIKEDVINASDFHHGYYNDDDISIAFQRVTLGRMGHPDWQIYHSCTDTEVNTMKQNVKVNTPIHIRPASPEEAGLFYSELEEAADKKLGTVGHVRMDFGSSGKGFYQGMGETVIPPELQYVEVISVTASSGYDANTGEAVEDEKELPSTVTLLVTTEQAKVLAGLEQESELHLALVYRGTPENASAFIEAQDALIEELYAEPEAEETAEATENTETGESEGADSAAESEAAAE